jgi:hypothetical protein
MSSQNVQYGKNVTLFLYHCHLHNVSKLTCYAARRNIVRNVSNIKKTKQLRAHGWNWYRCGFLDFFASRPLTNNFNIKCLMTSPNSSLWIPTNVHIEQPKINKQTNKQTNKDVHILKISYPFNFNPILYFSSSQCITLVQR